MKSRRPCWADGGWVVGRGGGAGVVVVQLAFMGRLKLPGGQMWEVVVWESSLGWNRPLVRTAVKQDAMLGSCNGIWQEFGG